MKIPAQTAVSMSAIHGEITIISRDLSGYIETGSHTGKNIILNIEPPFLYYIAIQEGGFLNHTCFFQKIVSLTQ